jgi:hypothetical protein
MKRFRLSEIKNKGSVIVYASILAGIILRFFMLDKAPVNAYESGALSLSAGHDIIQVIIQNLAAGNSAPLYAVIEYIWSLVFGWSEISMRILPAIFGAASVLIIQKLTRTFYSEKTSIIAASFFALSPFQIYFSHQASPATLTLMTSLMMLYYFMQSVKYNSFASGPFTFWAVAALYSSHETILLLLILNAILFLRYKEEIRINLWIRSQIFILLCWFPLFPYALRGVVLLGGGARENLLAAPFISFKNMIMGYTMDINFLTIIAAAAAAFFLLMGVVTFRKAKEKRMTDILSLSMFGMILVPWIGAMTGRMLCSDSSLLMAAALLVILVAIGISYLSNEGFLLCTAAMFVLFSFSIKNYFMDQKYSAPDVRKMYVEIMEQFAPGDIIIHSSDGTYAPFEFYNTRVYKKNLPDFVNGTVPEYKGPKWVRNQWRNIKQHMGLDINAGYDRNIIAEQQIKTMITPGARIWYISETTEGVKQGHMITGYTYFVPVKHGQSDAIRDMLVKNMAIEKETADPSAVITLMVKR